MAAADYILCDNCDQKVIYDGNDNARDSLENKYGEEYIFYCPKCLKELLEKYESLRNIANKSCFKLKPLSLGIVDENETPYDVADSIMRDLYEEANK